MVHCLPDSPSSAKFYPPGVDVVLHISPQKADAKWYRSANGYYMTSETVPAKAIVMVSVVGSSEVVHAEGDRPPDLKSVAKAVLRVQSQGSRTSAPSRSSAARVYMSAPNASCCSRNATIDRWVGQSVHNKLNVCWQDPLLLEHVTGRVPRELEHRGRRLPQGSLCHQNHKPCSSRSFTRTQICLMLCLLLCMNHWVGMVYVATSRYTYFWATVKLSKGIYRRRRYLKFPKQREEISQAASPANSPIYESRTGPKSSSHRRQVRAHLFVLLLFCITHKMGATKGMAEARVVADTSAATGAVSRLTMSMPSYGENTGEAGRSLANGLRWTAKRALRRARARAEKEGGARYRGRWYTAEQLSQTRQGVAPIPTEIQKSSASKATPVAKQETGKRIKCMTFSMAGVHGMASRQSTTY